MEGRGEEGTFVPHKTGQRVQKDKQKIKENKNRLGRKKKTERKGRGNAGLK